MVNDIVRRNQTDEALQDANQLNIEIVSQAGEGIVVYDRDFRYVAWNRFMERMTGVLAKDVLGRNALDLFPHLHEQGVDQMLKRALNGETVNSPDIQFYSTFTDLKGWVAGTYAPHRNASSEIIGVIATLQDITERKKAEEALQISESKYRLLHNTIMDAFASVDMDGRITDFNESYRRMLGYEPDELSALTYTDLTPMKWHTFEDKIVNEEVLLKGYSDIYEKEYRKKDGTVFPVELRTFLLRDDTGDPTGMWAIVRDITERKRAEEALRDSENKLATIIEFLPDATFVIDLEGKVVAWNRAMEEMTGVSKDDMIGQGDHAYTVPFYGERRQHLLDLLDKDDEEITSKYQYVQRKGDTLYAETYAPALHGGKGAYVWATVGPIFDVQGNRTGAIESIRDITERKRAEEALQEAQQTAENSKARYEQVVSMISDIVWSYEVNAQGEYIDSYISPVADRMLGLPDGTIGNSIEKYFSYIHPDDLPGVREMLSKGIRTLAKDLTMEYRLQKANGTTIWVRSRGSAYSLSDGRVTAFGTTSDITERKRAEEELKRTQSSIRIAMDLVKLVRWEYDVDIDMFTFDDQFYTLYGTTAEREGGPLMSSQEYARKFIHPEDASIVAKEISKALATTDPNYSSQLEHRIIRADGTERIIAVRYGITKDSKGRTIRTYGANQDITERKKAEEELRQNRDHLEERVRERTSEMERFIYTVSHDLRSPLVTVSGFLGLLKGDLENGDSQHAFGDLITISEAITKMDCLLTDTLELSRIGRVANPPEEVPFDQIVQEALRQTAERLKSLDVAIYVAGDMPKVQVDVQRISEVLINLIENSVKYLGDQERPEIDIGSRKDGDETVFFVKDNGIGIDPNENEKVFGLFYKVDRKSEGTGVGLAIVKRIIEVHGGRIWIESEQGKGCTVCFTLPLANGMQGLMKSHLYE